MKVHVEFLNDEHTKARITLVPGWLGRLFGAKSREGEAARSSTVTGDWTWRSSGRSVDARFSGHPILEAIEMHEVNRVVLAKAKAILREIAKPTEAA